MAVCHKCGSEIAEGSSACHCGAPVESSMPQRSEDRLSMSETLFMPSQERLAEGIPDDTVHYPAPPEVDPTAKTEEKVTTNDVTLDAQTAAAGAMTEPVIENRTSGLRVLAPGIILNNRYEIVRKIGGGGMGAVYLALDRNLGGVERAVKEMVQSSIEEEQQKKAVEDFKRESMILTTLDHPSIPTIYDYFFDEAASRFYLVMKYVSGGDLAARLRATPGGRIDEKTVTEWAAQIIDVLNYLHSLPAKIVYRDLKPSNVMIDGNTGRIMLIDFGIARSINQAEKGVTAVGTMGYAPPELFSGQVEPRSDIYSLGSTMFHLLTGADPQNNPLLIFDFQKNPRPRQINPQLSDQMERILMRAVEYNAEARFASAAELSQVLTDHLENLRNGAVTYGVTEIPAAVSLANQTVFCGFCGQRIVATDLYCAFCGSKQPIAQQGVHAEIYARSGVTAKLVVDGTSELQAPVFSLEKNDNIVGRRDPQANIFPEVDLSRFDPQTKISRRHARIWNEGGTFLVEDLGSSNGTVLVPSLDGSVRLQPHHPHPIGNGDRLRLGDTTLHFVIG
jgi:serine/threonine-protein kinase